MHIFTPQRDDDRSRPRPDGEAEEQEDVLRRPGQGLPQHLPEEDPLKGQLSVLITISRARRVANHNLFWSGARGREGNLYRVIQPKSHNLAPTYFLHTWSNLKTLWHGKSQHV